MTHFRWKSPLSSPLWLALNLAILLLVSRPVRSAENTVGASATDTQAKENEDLRARDASWMAEPSLISEFSAAEKLNTTEAQIQSAFFQIPRPLGAPTDEDRSLRAKADESSKKLAWVKGDYSIVPYGSLWGSAIYASDRCIPGPFILYVASSTLEGEDDFVIDTRRSRLGFDVAGPRVPLFGCASSGGRVEVDFQAALGTAEGLRVVAPENQTAVQIRHAYAEIKDENFRLMAGQTWDLFSPLNPGMLTYAVGWGGGNIGFRRMQIRYEHYLHLGNSAKWSLQGAVAQDIALDFVQVAETANWPVLQARCGLDFKPLANCQPIALGVSSHIGEQGFDFTASATLPAQDDARIVTWSINADARWPITTSMGIQGEFFTGENLSAFLGGIIQGVNPETRLPIASTGGWFEFWYDWTPRLHSHLGFGIDDPHNAHIANGGRTRNSFLFVNGSYDILPQMTVGLELSYWETNYLGLAPGEAMVYEFTGAYAF